MYLLNKFPLQNKSVTSYYVQVCIWSIIIYSSGHSPAMSISGLLRNVN